MFFFTDHSEEIACVLTGLRLLAKAAAFLKQSLLLIQYTRDDGTPVDGYYRRLPEKTA